MSKSSEFEPLADVMDEYILTWRTTWAEKTLQKYNHDFGLFRRWLRETGAPETTESLTKLVFLRYRGWLEQQPVAKGFRGDPEALARGRASATRTLSKQTVHSAMRNLRALCLWALDEDHLSENPFQMNRRRGGANPLLPTEETVPKSATDDDIEALRRGCEGASPFALRDRAIVELLCTTGARNGSIRNLRMSDIDLVGDNPTVTFYRGKGNKSQVLPLLPSAVLALRRYKRRGRAKLLPRYPVRGYEETNAKDDSEWLFVSGLRDAQGRAKPLSGNGLSQMLTRRYKAGGGEDKFFGSHRIRHWLATTALNAGLDIALIKTLYGHTSMTTTLLYARLSVESMRDQLTRVLGDAPTRPARRHRRSAA